MPFRSFRRFTIRGLMAAFLLIGLALAAYETVRAVYERHLWRRLELAQADLMVAKTRWQTISTASASNTYSCPTQEQLRAEYFSASKEVLKHRNALLSYFEASGERELRTSYTYSWSPFSPRRKLLVVPSND